MQAAFNLAFALTVTGSWRISNVICNAYYTDGGADSLVATSISAPGNYSVNMPLPSRNSPNYGQIFGIKVSMTLASTDPMAPGIANYVADTGLGFITLPGSYQPYVSPAYGTVEESERQYWEGSQGSGMGNGSPTPPPTAPPSSPPPPPSYPNAPSMGITL